MKNNKNRLSFQAQLSRHSHDLSAGYNASMTTGQIIPQYFHILSPGDKIYCDFRMFCRLQKIVTAFLGEIDVHVDTFFVPLQMLYTPFGQMFAQTNDYISSLIDLSSLEVKDGWPLYDVELDGFQNFMPNTKLYGHTECVGKESVRLFDALDLNPFVFLNQNIQQNVEYTGSHIPYGLCHQIPISPFVLCAYQAIYQKYYRNDEFEKLNIQTYNIDQYYNRVKAKMPISTLRYIQRAKDYFTETRVSPMFSAVNSAWNTNAQDENYGGDLPSGYPLTKILEFLSPNPSGFLTQRFGSTDDYRALNGFDAVSSTSVNAHSSTSENDYINTANIRALFAVDKFARIYGRADKTYDSQILAHFGIEIPHDVKHDLTHVGHYHAVLQSDPIYGTANAINNDDLQISAIGEVGGQGQCVLTGKCDFKAPVHGIFMAVAYIVTKPRYFGTFSKLHLATDRLHLPIPEFDKLGAQPLYYFEFNPSNLDSSVDGMTSARAGWQNRYQEFKSKYNRISLNYFGGNYHTSATNNNIYAPWVVSRLPFDDDLNIGPSTSSFISPSRFFEPANSLDGIMVNTFHASWSNSYFEFPHLIFQSDPILTEFYNNCKLVSWMSETGEPDL